MAGTLSTVLSVAGIAAGLTGAGVGAYDANNASIDSNAAQQASKDATLKAQQTAANQADLTKKEAVLGAQGQTQQQTGGSLTDSGTSALTDLLAGYPGYQGGTSSSAATSTGTGTGVGGSGVSGNTSSATSAGAPNIAAILAALRGQGGAGSAGGSSSLPISLAATGRRSPQRLKTSLNCLIRLSNERSLPDGRNYSSTPIDPARTQGRNRDRRPRLHGLQPVQPIPESAVSKPTAQLREGPGEDECLRRAVYESL